MSTPVVKIQDLPAHVGREVVLEGWAVRSRRKGKIAFLVVRDGTGTCQGVASAKQVDEKVFETIDLMDQEASVRVRGEVREDPRSPSGVELGIQDVEVFGRSGEYPLTPKEHGPEFLLDHRHLHMRHQRPWAIFRIRHEVEQACRDYMYEKGFILVDSPILTPAACEGTSTLFETDYFGDPAYLSQSGQLYVEPACMAFDKVYCFGPTFRAEKSKTRRHLTEFWMIEPEIAWAGLDDLMALAEDFVSYIVQRVLERRKTELAVLERDTARLESALPPFPRISYDEASEILVKPESVEKARAQNAPPFEPGSDLGAADETILGEPHDRPRMIHRYPSHVMAFYMEPDPDDASKALCVDMIAPEGYGEIIGGSVRIHDPELLEKRIKEHDLPEEAFRWYMEIRKFGTVPHAGFGMGVERVVAWICGVHHLREVIPYPRTIARLYP